MDKTVVWMLRNGAFSPVSAEKQGGTPSRFTLWGVVNVTPDSFFDGGRHPSFESAFSHARRLAADGARVLDLGGASSRPGAQDVPSDDEMRRVYTAVAEAQQAGIQALAPGAKCKDVYAAAYSVLESYGYAPYFRHSLGHGVGLQIHEGYNASPKSADTFAPGNVTSIEPGVYLPGKFGVRTEDLLAVTETGKRNFTTLPKELVIL